MENFIFQPGTHRRPCTRIRVVGCMRMPGAVGGRGGQRWPCSPQAWNAWFGQAAPIATASSSSSSGRSEPPPPQPQPPLSRMPVPASPRSGAGRQAALQERFRQLRGDMDAAATPTKTPPGSKRPGGSSPKDSMSAECPKELAFFDECFGCWSKSGTRRRGGSAASRCGLSPPPLCPA